MLVTDNQTATTFSRTNPFHAKVLKNVNLNGANSYKETRHLELSLKGSSLSYVPGDALDFPQNDPGLVTSLLEEMKWDEETLVTINKEGDTLPLRDALTTYFEITLLSKKILQQAVEFTGNEELRKLLLNENANQLKEYNTGVICLICCVISGHGMLLHKKWCLF